MQVLTNRRARARFLRRLPENAVVYITVILLTCFSLLPFFWMISTSLKPITEVFQVPPRWIPANPTLHYYANVLNPEMDNAKLFMRYLINSTVVTFATTILSVLVAVPAAYAFSRFSFPGRTTFFFAVLCRNMFPLVVFLIPLFILMRVLMIQDTYFALIIAYLTFALPLAIWLLKGFFDGIPVELEKSARIDGCTRFGAFIRIIVPLSSPGVIATAIYSFVIAWNEYVYALTLTSSPEMRTLPVGLTFFFAEHTVDWAGLMATAVAMSVPVVVFFLVLQKYFVQALAEGAVKY